jgi:hypothetical protein
LVEQRIENPRVGGSIPPQATTFQTRMKSSFHAGFVFSGPPALFAIRVQSDCT